MPSIQSQTNKQTNRNLYSTKWGPLHEPKFCPIWSSTNIILLHTSWSSVSPPHANPIFCISFLTLHIIFGLPWLLLWSPWWQHSTLLTGASCDLHLTCPNHHNQFSFIISKARPKVNIYMMVKVRKFCFCYLFVTHYYGYLSSNCYQLTLSVHNSVLQGHYLPTFSLHPQSS